MSEQTDRKDSPITNSVEKLRQELDRWLETAWTQSEKALDAIGIRGCEGQICPAVDVVESANDVVVYADLPGNSAESVQLELAGNMLTIRAERPVMSHSEDDVFHRRERRGGRFERSIPLPAPINADEIIAEVVDGCLKVRLPKSEKARARQIEIRSSSPQTHQVTPTASSN